MRCAFIGAGKVGVTLGKYFTDVSACQVTGYFSRNKESAIKAANFTQSEPFDTISDLIASCDAIFITVPDDAIKGVYEEVKRNHISGKQIIHCSGSLNTGVFDDIKEHQAFGLSIHPLYAFSQPYEENPALKEAVFTLEGRDSTCNSYLEFWKEVLENAGNTVVQIKSEDKVTYHTAAVMSSNLVLGLLNMSSKLLTECGFSEEEALKAIEPLVMNNLKKAFADGLPQALTGPIERGDVGTYEAHMMHLEGDPASVYRNLSKSALDLAKRKNRERDYKGIEEKL